MNARTHLTLTPKPAGGLRLVGAALLLAAGVSGCGGVQHPPGKVTGGGHTRAAYAAAAASSGSKIGSAVAGPQARAPFIAAGPVIKSFTGEGDRTLGSLAERGTVVVQWRTSGSSIQLFTAQGHLLIDAVSPVGRVRLPRGDYSGLHVAARGRWTVQLRLTS